MNSRKRRFCRAILTNITSDTVYGLTSSIKEAPSVIESPAGKQELLTVQSTPVLQHVPFTEPGSQSGDVKLIVLRCSLQQRERVSIFSRLVDVQ